MGFNRIADRFQTQIPTSRTQISGTKTPTTILTVLSASASSITTADVSDSSYILNTITSISDCPSLGDSYEALTDSDTPFTINCTTDFPGDDMLDVYVYTMEGLHGGLRKLKLARQLPFHLLWGGQL